MTAAKGDQFAGALPGARRPAFSYLVLGGLRGWAGGKEGRVRAGDLRRYANDALDATLRGRNQTPELIGRDDAVMAASAGEKGPNLAAMAKATAGAGAQEEMFKVSSLPAVPRAEAPKALGAAGAGGLDFRSMDVEALEKYGAARKFDKGDASAEDKAESWRRLAKDAPKFAEVAEKRALEWDSYAAQKKAAEEAREKRVEARDSDWEKLSRLLALDVEVVPEPNKKRWAGQFIEAYLGSPGLEPEMAKAIVPHLPAGPQKEALKELSKSAPAESVQPTSALASRVKAGKAGIEWVRIPGGTFSMGTGNGDEGPAHQVNMKTFQMAKSEVTNKQYRACVEAGACAPPSSYEGGDDQPVVNVDWNKAKAFSEWVGGRLPTEAEWEYAARSAGKDRKYPWGDGDATCERAVISGCSSGKAEPVCSKPRGNTQQGLCDMAGNVWEWVQDWYHNSYNGAPSDGSAWESPTGSFRVNRGGSWSHDAGDARAADRNNIAPGSRNVILGFRPSRSSSR
ncbi:MAG: formylglycine-generating enzyme family protein [Elusimicrobia bacterium]|nr:formylglycine-generating enzyme family protein [Elusimicrobiota bacterium]